MYENTYENGVISHQFATDVDDAVFWQTRETTYNADGERLTLTTTFDDGTVDVINFDDTMMS